MKLNNVMAFAALCVSNCVASDVSEMVNNKLKVESLQLKKESLQLEYQLKMNEIDHQMKEITGQNSTSTNNDCEMEMCVLTHVMDKCSKKQEDMDPAEQQCLYTHGRSGRAWCEAEKKDEKDEDR